MIVKSAAECEKQILIDSPLMGEWMARVFLSNGNSVDHSLSLSPDGSFEWTTWAEQRELKTERGIWKHDHHNSLIHFFSENGDSKQEQSWQILEIADVAKSNTVLILRQQIFAGRNLLTLPFSM